MMKRAWLAAIAALALSICFGVSPAQAVCGPVLNPLSVSTTSIAFGNYDPSVDRTANATISVDCTLNDILPSFDAAILAGNSNPSYVPRKMTYLLSASPLNYNIFIDGSYGTVWGNGTQTTQTKHHTQTSGVRHVTMTAFGKIPSGQFVTPGLYNDSLTVQITF